MTQIFFPSDSDSKQQKLYCYVNRFEKLVIAKISCLQGRDCERVLFPQEKFLFLADDDCQLEIHQQTDIGIVKDVIACSQLDVVKEENCLSPQV